MVTNKIEFDIHSIVHFIGCFSLAMSFYVLGVNHYAFLAFGLGVLWEVFDEVNYQFQLYVSFLDYRGADVGDIIVDFGGTVLAVIIIHFAVL